MYVGSEVCVEQKSISKIEKLNFHLPLHDDHSELPAESIAVPHTNKFRQSTSRFSGSRE